MSAPQPNHAHKKNMKAKELRAELGTATSGYAKGWRVNRKAKELEPGEYAFIRNDHHCRRWRIVLNPTNEMVELQQYSPGVDTKGCDCTIKDEYGFHVPNPECSICGGSWEIPVDYVPYATTKYSNPEAKRIFRETLKDLYFYGTHPIMGAYYK